jgi:hypothetical protein
MFSQTVDAKVVVEQVKQLSIDVRLGDVAQLIAV